MKSLCFCIGRLSTGGAERQIVYIASLLAERGYDVSLLVIKSGDAYLEHLSDKITLKRLNLAGFFTSARALKAEVNALAPDVVVGFLFHASLLLRAVSVGLSCPVVSVHRNVSCGSRQRDLLMKCTSPLDRLTVTNTRQARRRLHSRFARGPLVVVPNIYFAPQQAIESSARSASQGLVWGYVGRLEAQKNLSLLLHAFTVHSQEFPSATLHIVGDGPERATLHALAEQLGVAGRVVFVGYTQDVHSELARMDAFIMTSVREGMPNALIEAMAAGLPVVSTAVGEVPTMIKSGETGVLCDNFSVEAVAGAMGRIEQLSDAERHGMGEAAREYVVATCSPQAVIDQWERVLQQAVGNTA